ncbi:MAG: hypothetical protein RR643_04595 [Anaerorhabdus sp.]|uniref:hypothetical protein n=1 Tax=Anaerorhabdus sp. TaxID=1872524 RepID=UPI002FC97F58
MIFCTLFDSRYLDKGLALYSSLVKVKDEFKLYVFCFDEQCYNILNDMRLKYMVLIRLCDFETEDLINVKNTRSPAEYCWTCTPFIIKYVLEKFNEECCTYIDADIYFFSSPKILFNEIPKDKDVMIVSHFFSNTPYDRVLEKLYGKYCVQFNFFRNNEYGMQVLNWWADKCYEWCYAKIEKDRMGDQKYLNKFELLFPQTYAVKNRGAGIAPWNFKQYTYDNHNFVYINDKKIPVVFYHFQNLRYISSNSVNINIGKGDNKLKQYLYCNYQYEILIIREKLMNNYDIKFDLKKNYSRNVISKFIRRNIMQYAIRNKNDIISYDNAIQYVEKVEKEL